MITAIAFYLVASVALIAIERRLVRFADVDPGIDWLNDHVYTPLLRTFVVLGFVALAYPALFGLADAPPLLRLLRGGRADLALTAAFAISLVLPLVPGIYRLPGAVLALQGILACCLLAGWLAEHYGVQPRLWAGWVVVAQVGAALVAGKLIGKTIVKIYVPRRRERDALVVEEAARMLSEIPAIALYADALGRFLSAG